MRQVGRTCLKDYTGIDPSVAVLWAAVHDLIDRESVCDCGPEELESRGIRRMYDVSEVLAYACDTIKSKGYRKVGMLGCTRDVTINALMKHDEVSAEAKEAAEQILGWMKGELVEQRKKEDTWNTEMRQKAIQRAFADGYTMEEIDADDCICYEYMCQPEKNPYMISDMERNCIPLALSGWAKRQHIGLLAYMPVDYEKYMERKAREARWEEERQTAAAVSDYVGKVKERITIQVATARLVTSWETDYGVTYLYKFVDQSGNVFVWRASRSVEVSDGMIIKGTVKEHSEYDGVKQTVLTRCAVA